jgi:hypothetical protein
MNVRLSTGEVRLRLERAEAEALARGEPLSTEVAFPGGARLAWRVDPRTGMNGPSVLLRGTEMVVTVSADALTELLGRPPSKDAGVVADLPTEGGTLTVRVEVDFFSARRR